MIGDWHHRTPVSAFKWAIMRGCYRLTVSSSRTRVIEPKEGPGVELATLEDAARFMGHMRPWRQARPHWDYAAELVLVAATTGEEAPAIMTPS